MRRHISPAIAVLLLLHQLLVAFSSSPTPSPTASPTQIPSTAPTGYEVFPIAYHQLVVVDPAASALIRLRGFDELVANLKYSIRSITTASLFQLSQIFSSYGYEPKAGTLIDTPNVAVTGSGARVYYKRPELDSPTHNKWDTFTYTANNGRYDSYPGTVTLVPPSGALVGSDFLLGSDGWTIVGNKVDGLNATFEAFSRGPLLNYYVYGSDDKINADASSADKSLWFFKAPNRYLGNQGISYGGYLRFTLGSFSGDFSKSNGPLTPVVILQCESCQGPVGAGITLMYPIKNLRFAFTGAAAKFVLPLKEDGGWLKDPQNTLLPWSVPTKCDMLQVLSRLSNVQILGDWTTWYESLALDDVIFTNTKAQVPLCAMRRPDASLCDPATCY